MKWAALLLCSFSCLAGLPEVKTVYLFPMSNGMDQYLANHLTKAGFYQVVTDPKKADAVFTDRLGEAFEDKLNEVYAVPQKADGKDKGKDKDKDKESSKDVAGYSGAGPRSSTFGGGKGNIFLVDVKSRTVLWSIHARPKNLMAEQLDRNASRVVESLQETLHPKPKQ